MNTGMISYECANHPLIATGLAQTAKRYGRPRMVADRKLNGAAEVGMPHTFSEPRDIALSTMTGTDL